MNSFLKLVLLFVIVAFATANSEPINPTLINPIGGNGRIVGGGLAGGYSPATVASLPRNIDSFVRRSKPELRTARIVRVESQVVAGTNWRITYQTRTVRYEVVVFDQSWTRTRRITSFRRL